MNTEGRFKSRKQQRKFDQKERRKRHNGNTLGKQRKRNRNRKAA